MRSPKTGLFLCRITSFLKSQYLLYFYGVMMRGHKALYTSVFPSSITAEPDNKGKRNVFIEVRHDKMACRYYFHAEICRLRYDDCLKELSEEFDLSPNVVAQCLMKRVDLIKKLVADKAQASEFRKKYPYYNWSTKAA